jgi:hypothetical protein
MIGVPFADHRVSIPLSKVLASSLLSDPQFPHPTPLTARA